jgi:hypothetical protein
VLQVNLGDDLSILENGNFVFPTEFLTGLDILDLDAIEQVRGLVRDYIENLSKVNNQVNIGPKETQVYGINLDVYKI